MSIHYHESSTNYQTSTLLTLTIIPRFFSISHRSVAGLYWSLSTRPRWLCTCPCQSLSTTAIGVCWAMLILLITYPLIKHWQSNIDITHYLSVNQTLTNHLSAVTQSSFWRYLYSMPHSLTVSNPGQPWSTEGNKPFLDWPFTNHHHHWNSVASTTKLWKYRLDTMIRHIHY